MIVLTQFCLILSACGGTQRQNPWPSAERVQALTQNQNSQSENETKTYAQFVEWAMVQSPQIAGAIPLRPVTPLEKVLEDQTRQHAHMTPTEANTCLSRELARFLVEEGNPTQTLLKFLARRCGVIHAQIAYSVFSFDGKTDEDAIAQTSVPNIQNALAPFATATAPMDLGIGMFSNEKQAYIVISTSQKTLEIQPVNMHVEGTKVEIQGTSLMPNVGHMWASINQGTHGFEACERDERVVLPSFKFTCNVFPGDPYAAISIAQKEKEKFLGEHAAGLFVASNKQPDNVYRPPRIRYELLDRATNTNPVETEVVEAEVQEGESAPTAELPKQLRFTPLPQIGRRADTYEADIITLINAVRTGQNLTPITLESAQSKTVTLLAPTLFNTADSKLQDEIAMAIMAGWDVNGAVVNGDFQSGRFASSDPVEHLDALLDEPDGRAHLLAPGLSSLAIGSNLGKISQVVLAGYHFAPQQDAKRHIGQVFRKINTQRQQLGLPPATESKKNRSYAGTVSSKIAKNEMDVDDASNKLMEKMVAKHNRGVRGYVMRVNDLDEIQLPRPVLARKDLTVSIAVALHQDPGFPWYEYVVIIAYLD